MTAYHGTNKDISDKIDKEGFKKISELLQDDVSKDEGLYTNWIGDGVYFYLDYGTAVFWAKNPDKRYGTSTDNPVVIKVEIDVPSLDSGLLVDSRILEHYDFLRDKFNEFHNQNFMKLKTNEKNGYERYRKLYFDWLNSNYGIEVFIIGFYKSKSNNSIVEGKFKIPYVEYQMCVFEKERIRRPYEVISK